ncbi:MAG: L-carnitine dehydratase/bile acid-inducible protein, partial [Ilumatobacteraceae bacterium]|nr:L-carnitine dehydratase/bile acid-inducible protein [Ilumatobacteraceae bacterium]
MADSDRSPCRARGVEHLPSHLVTITHRRSGDHRHLPLHGIRVLECGDTLAAAYAGRLFVELGADVVKVELLGGDPLRRVGPFAFPPVVDADPGANAGAAAGPSVSFAYYHAGKRSVAVDHAAVASATLLGDLARRADVVIRCTASGDDWIDDEALHDAQLANPGLVVVDISTYGRQSGDASMSDLLALAASGLLLLNVDSDGNPLRYRGELASVHAAADAVLAAISALLGRLGDGAGQRIDISAQAATAAILTAIAIYTYTGDLPQFGGLPAIAPWGFFECADGTALIMVNEDAQWVGLRRVLGEPEWAAIELFDTNAVRRENFELVNALVAEALKERGLDELLAACTRDGVPASKVHTAADVVAWPHLHERGYLAPLDVGTGDQPHTVLAPGSPWRFARTTAPPISRRAPRLGEHTSTAVQDWETATDTPEARSIGAAAAAPAAPLAGRRVVDMTWVWAGPYAAMQFAHLGADVVKAESDRRIDVTRILNPFADDVRGVNRSGYFNMYSQGKRSITVDVTQPDGLALLKRIIAGSDLIMDNMRPGAMVRLGLGPDVLEALEPALVAVAMSGFGETGPERDQMAYGAVIDALCGVSASNGPPGVGPTFFPMSMPDPCAGIHASIAAAAAIYRAQRTGRGDRVEISMTEATIAAFPWPVLIESAGAGPVVNVGNRDDTMCPHGTFACAGTRQWLAVVSRDDADFAALASVIGRPELATDARFATFAARKQHEDEVEAAVSAWTSTRSRAEAAAELTAAGV